MFFIGSNNGNDVDVGTIKKYMESEHRANSIYGISKNGFFWGKDITFNSKETAKKFIKSYESRGFAVHHNIDIAEADEVAEKNETEASALDIGVEVKPVEEVKRKGSSRGRRKE